MRDVSEFLKESDMHMRIRRAGAGRTIQARHGARIGNGSWIQESAPARINTRPLGRFPMGICKRIHSFERRRLPDCISLDIVHSDFTQSFEYLVALDKFGNGAFAHYLCYVNDHFDHGPVDLTIQHFRDKAAIYLDVVDREMLQVRERRHPSAKIVQGEATAQLL